jgi:chemotaxis protein methyltransferase CheR
MMENPFILSGLSSAAARECNCEEKKPVFLAQTLGSMDDTDFRRLAYHIKKKYGLNLDGRKAMVESRLYHYVIDRGFDSFSEYLETVYDGEGGHNSTEMANIINRLTTNYTYFMREQEHYRHFGEKFLPDMERTVADGEICIWSAGCSFGNEAYNFAMCMEEYFKGKDNGWDRKILATDISQNAILAAKKGMFSEAVVKSLPDSWRRKYFTEKNGIYTVSPDIRSQVAFKYHNLMEPIAFKKKFDLIICRNVMIYFDGKTKSELIKRFYEATKPGGYLYIGHAESMPTDSPYVREQTAVYRKL